MAWKPDYVASADLKAFLRIADAADDIELGFAITAASRAVDKHTHRQFGKVAAAEERVYPAQWDRRRSRWLAVIDDLQTVTGFTVENSDADAITDYALLPRNNLLKGKPYEVLVINPSSAVKPVRENGEYLLTMAGVWGWTTTPTGVKEATLLQASRFHARRFSPYGIAGSPDQGSELRLLARVDPDVAVSLSEYVRWWAAA